MFQKLNRDAEGLKALWVARLNLKGRSDMASPEDLRAYEKANDDVRISLFFSQKRMVQAVCL